MILIIDNYDSFSYNLVQMIGEIKDKDEEIKIIRNDELTVEQIIDMKPSHIVISPGPGKPADAGVCEELIKRLATEEDIPLMGVCLGHQAICEALGGRVTYAEQLMHGKQSEIDIDTNSVLFAELPKKVKVARYHSLVAQGDKMPDSLVIIAQDGKKEVMAVQHRDKKIYGVQFHPESIMTPEGRTMLSAFLAVS